MTRALSLSMGLLLGFSLSRIGFTDYAELQKMFTFREPRMLLVFAGAVLLTGVAYRLLPAGRALAPRPISRRVIAGGLVFGLGWVVCGACPGAAFAQLGEGKLFALVTLAGIALGTRAYGLVEQRRVVRSAESCGG
jgi:uncharacterized membrane protein YedE/YeeE